MSEQTAQSQLRTIVERVERVEEEIAGLNGDKRDIFAEAKANGFDVKALKAVLSIRRKEPSERSEHNAMVSLYLSTLGMADAADEVEQLDPRPHVHVHVREAAE